MMRITLVAVTLILCGCTSKPEKQIAITGNSVSEEMESPVIQPVATVDEDAVLKIAKQAVRDNDTWADRAEYTATKEGDEWNVLVWRLPKVPGGYRYITIGSSGAVIEYERGR